MGWPFFHSKYLHQTETLDYILVKHSKASFFEQCYLVQACSDFPVEWLVYLALNQQHQHLKPLTASNYFFIEDKPCRNDFKLLLVKTLGHEQHHYLRMVVDNRYYSKSWLYYNQATTLKDYRYTNLKKCYKYIHTLNNPSLWFKIKFTYYDLMESIDNIFVFPHM